MKKKIIKALVTIALGASMFASVILLISFIAILKHFLGYTGAILACLAIGCLIAAYLIMNEQ